MIIAKAPSGDLTCKSWSQVAAVELRVLLIRLQPPAACI